MKFAMIKIMVTQQLKSWKELRRFKALELLEGGWSQQQIAKAYGVNQSTVSNWKRAYEQNGASGLKLKTYPGKRPRLDTEEEERLKACLDQGASSFGFIGDFWTQKRVSRLIQEQFSVDLKPRSCGDLLKRLGYSLKKPRLKSYDQKPEKVKEWKEAKLPEIKKSES